MKATLTSILRYALPVFPFALAFLNLECSLPSYDNPTPGIIEIHLHTISTKIPFLGKDLEPNNFILTLTQAQAIRADYARLTIYQDIKAINRVNSVFNTLDSLAADSSLVMGQAYAPPGHYIGISLLMTPGSEVVEDGYRIIPVDTTGTNFNPLLTFHGSFDIQENATTRVVLTIDLDQSLQKGADNFYFWPTYYISSIQ